MIVIGIDPGVDGGLAVLRPDGVAAVLRMPTITSTIGKSKRRSVDGVKLKAFFNQFSSSHSNPSSHQGNRIVVMEKVHSMPRQGVASSFSFGETFGFLKGMCAMGGIPLQLVTPQEWKKAMLGGIGHDKGASVLRVSQLFPEVAEQVGKHDGMAEALLIAEYGRRITGGIIGCLTGGKLTVKAMQDWQ